MSPLPLEVLALAFKYLGQKDLLQCQLTSKQWHKASVNFLYSNLDRQLSETFRLYVRTISNSLTLGSHLKTINTSLEFKPDESKKLWDKHGLLDAIIQKCPNLLRLECSAEDLSFWIRVSYAASQGQLSRLQRLPTSNSQNLESYIYTALQFKKTLKYVSIVDDKFYYGTDLNRLKMYQALLDQINEFGNLKAVTIHCHSDKQLSCFDELIESHPQLQEVTLTLIPVKDRGITIEPKEFIQPRPDIRSLTCNWEAIKNQSQLKYVMQKFPNLRSLNISSYSSRQTKPAYCPASAFIEFWHFATAVPKFEVEMEISDQEAIKVWNEVINVKEMYKDISVYFFNGSRLSCNPIFEPKPRKLYLKFPILEDVIEYQHIKYFSKSGNMIRSLTLEALNDPFDSMMDPSYPVYDFCSSLEGVFQILQLCPSLQELTMSLPDESVELSNHVPQNTSVKKLNITQAFEISEQTDFLKLMSLKLPNLKELRLEYYSSSDEDNDGSPVTIIMPNTSFDLLFWDLYESCTDIDDDFKVYVKLQTEYDIRFYSCSKSGVLPIKIKQYQQAVKNNSFHFDITCQSLKVLRFSSYLTFDWTF